MFTEKEYFWRKVRQLRHRMVILELSHHKNNRVPSGQNGFPLPNDQDSRTATSLLQSRFGKKGFWLRSLTWHREIWKKRSGRRCQGTAKCSSQQLWKYVSLRLCWMAEWTDELRPVSTLAWRWNGEKAGSIKVTYSLQLSCKGERVQRGWARHTVKNTELKIIQHSRTLLLLMHN